MLRGLRAADAFAAKLHPAVRARLDDECPGSFDDDGNRTDDAPSWTEAPREAIRTLRTEKPEGAIRKSARGGQNKQRARDEFLRRLADAYRACGMGDAGLFEFVRKAAADARPAVSCPSTEGAFFRHVVRRKPASDRA